MFSNTANLRPRITVTFKRALCSYFRLICSWCYTDNTVTVCIVTSYILRLREIIIEILQKLHECTSNSEGALFSKICLQHLLEKGQDMLLSMSFVLSSSRTEVTSLSTPSWPSWPDQTQITWVDGTQHKALRGQQIPYILTGYKRNLKTVLSISMLTKDLNWSWVKLYFSVENHIQAELDLCVCWFYNFQTK